MLALINETKSFLDFTMIVKMGIKNGYPQFQGDDNKIELIRAFLANPRERSDITISQFKNFVTNIEINDPQKKERLSKEFPTKNLIGKFLSSKEESKTSQRAEPVIEIQSIQISQMPDHPAIEIPSTPASPSNQNAIEIRSTSASQLSESSMIAKHQFQKPQLIPESQRLTLPLPQKIKTSSMQLFHDKKSGSIVTSELLFAPSDPNQPPHSTNQQEINNNSNQTSFQAQQLINNKSKKCCIIL